jgi:hypothetical protein
MHYKNILLMQRFILWFKIRIVCCFIVCKEGILHAIHVYIIMYTLCVLCFYLRLMQHFTMTPSFNTDLCMGFAGSTKQKYVHVCNLNILFDKNCCDISIRWILCIIVIRPWPLIVTDDCFHVSSNCITIRRQTWQREK